MDTSQEDEYLHGTLDDRLFGLAIDWLSKVDRREFYHRVVDFCATLLHSEVCALFVKTRLIDGSPRVSLVAGKLPPNHSSGQQRMDPRQVGSEPADHSYKITSADEAGQQRFDGITGKIASTGKFVMFNGYNDIAGSPGHAGRWDRYVWEGKQAERFRGMLGVAIRSEAKEIVGVIKVENKIGGQYTEHDKTLLIRIGQSLSSSLEELIREHRELSPEIEESEYRVPRSKPSSFERQKTGEVVLKHSMTAICQSDIYYFRHMKSRAKLDERLPLVLGHETTAEVFQVVGENRYINGPSKGSPILPKDKVVVIPLIPCGTCDVCKGDYGENYCPSSKFMASNAPGSLRSVYKYFPELILKIPDENHEKYALFTEPMSNVVQMLNELGFREKTDRIELMAAPKRVQEFNYFHMTGDSFTNVFDSITAEEPYPRTLFLLTYDGSEKLGYRRISHNNLMTKGLGLLGSRSASLDLSDVREVRPIERPKVLILGGGTMGFLLALVLREVCGIPENRIVVTGRIPSKLIKFHGIAQRKAIGDFMVGPNYNFETHILDDLITTGEPGKYDVVFECVGWPAVGQNVDLAMRVLKRGGIIALEGLAEQSIEVDFDRLIDSGLFVKGFYRGAIDAYAQSLRYITEYQKVQEHLNQLIDTDTEVNRIKGFHRVECAADMERLFDVASSKEAFGRLIIQKIA